ncbi:MAG: nucleotidyltransferase domain-containing protein [Verrucomicrobiaceae bacterium]|nr:nucleotidyltransferase domain-containing protein [Verrucomicrobiaceae bacterium]
MVAATDSTVIAASLREKAEPVIAEATRRLVEEFHPAQVWLFGSYAWGEPTEDSDLDLVVVIPSSQERNLERVRQANRTLRGLGLPKDVMVHTRSEFETYQDVVSSLTYKIMHEGRLLYG